MGRFSQYRDSKDVAHVAPFATFLLFLVLLGGLQGIGFTSDEDGAPWFRRAPEHWVYPLQTVITLGVLLLFRKHYEFRPRSLHVGVAAGIVGIVIWIAPGYLYRTLNLQPTWLMYFGFADRSSGFDPTFIREHSTLLYGLAIALRFVRMVVVAALVEEIFWRGFLMRYLVDPDGDYWEVPFGTPSVQSFFGVTVLVMLAHTSVDYAAAFLFGALAYWVAVYTRSLAACVVMHATANLILGVYTMATRQWGYW